jgi:L-alanine-DL-glutamate epimerase-like enolase superfamily enzyme
MADAALRLRGNTLKVKLGGRDGEDATRMAAVRAAAPDETLIVDANEGWTVDELHDLTAAMERSGVAMIEQPLPAGEDAALASLKTSIPICADESLHSSKDLSRVAGLYQKINIKLDKTGGLTEALLLRQRAIDLGLGYMVGCMLGSSLAMAPALMVTGGADFVDLDGPLWLKADRVHGLNYQRETFDEVSPLLWG